MNTTKDQCFSSRPRPFVLKRREIWQRKMPVLSESGTAHLLLEKEGAPAGVPGDFRLQSFEQLFGIRSACGWFHT